MHPDLSIIIPNKNGEKYLHETLISLENLDMNFEVILCDDNSNDKSREIFTLWAKNNLINHKIVSSMSIGTPSRPRNLGLRESKGKYLYFLDSDDIANAENLNLAMKEIVKNNSDLLLAPWNQFDVDLYISDGIDRKWFYYLQQYFGFRSVVFTPMELEFKERTNLFRLWGLTGSKIFRKTFLESHQIFWDEEIFYCEDTDFFISVLSKEPKISLFNLDLYAYRIGHTSQLSSHNSDAKLKKISDGLPKILEKNAESKYFFEIFANVFDIWIFSGINFPDKKVKKEYFQNSKSVSTLFSKSSKNYIHHGFFGVAKILLKSFRFLQIKVIWKIIQYAATGSVFWQFLILKPHQLFQSSTKQSDTNT
jgi:glycosyltransferase involved in cell wall biosynthesis